MGIEILVYIIQAAMLIAAILLPLWITRGLSVLFPGVDRKSVKAVLMILFLILSVLVSAAYFLPAGFFQKWFRRIGYFWMVAEAGLFSGMILSRILAEVVRRKRRIPVKTVLKSRFGPASVLLVIGLTTAFVIYGSWNASSNIQVTSYNVEADESFGADGEMRVVLVADQHFGYNAGCALAEKMVEKINSLDADLVIFAGDLFDNQYDAVEDPERLASILAGIQSRYGTYSCFGNHDVEDNLVFGFSFNKGIQLTDPRYEEFFEKAGIEGLADETVPVGEAFYLTGRRDYSQTGNASGTRLAPSELTDGLDQSRLILCIDHEPPKNRKAAAEIEAAGIDILLSGHTHNGQVFPGNLPMRFIGFNSYGYRVLGGLQSFTTSGVGAFGPYMRVGTKSEVMLIDIHGTAS